MEDKQLLSVIKYLYRIALNGQTKDYLSKEEFIVFCLNEKDIIRSITKSRINLFS
jgi:hypothetical protein